MKEANINYDKVKIVIEPTEKKANSVLAKLDKLKADAIEKLRSNYAAKKNA